jgi:hypothetical protein
MPSAPSYMLRRFNHDQRFASGYVAAVTTGLMLCASGAFVQAQTLTNANADWPGMVERGAVQP